MNVKDKVKGYEKEFSEEGFWDKITSVVKVVGCDLIEKALILYYVLKDPDTPNSVKALIYGALGYFISPVDAVPDAIPVVGFGDDLGVLIATMALLASSIKEEHKIKAKETIKKWCE